MRSLEDIRSENLRAAVIEALEKIGINQIVVTDKVGRLALEILEIDKQIAELERPVNVVGTPEAAIKQLQDCLRKVEGLAARRRSLVSNIVSALQGDFVNVLLRHLTTKSEEAQE